MRLQVCKEFSKFLVKFRGDIEFCCVGFSCVTVRLQNAQGNLTVLWERLKMEENGVMVKV